MKITLSVWAAATLFAMTQAAPAAPKVSGKYALIVLTQCEAKFTTTTDTYSKPGTGTTGPAVKSINTGQSGEFNMGVGSITFPAAASSVGNARLELVLVSGGTLRINGSGNAMSTHTENIGGPFSFTNTSFTLTPNGEPAMTWTLRIGNVVSGVARTLYLVRKETAACVNAITATKL